MIDCPKCGFNQPPDQYCANCGVDMQNYVPPKKPLHLRLASSPIFYVALVVVLIISASMLVTKQIRKTEKVPEVANFAQTFEEEESAALPAQQQNRPERAQPQTAASAPKPVEATKAAAPAELAKTKPATVNAFSPSRLRGTLYVARTSELDELLPTAKSLGTGGGFQSYSLERQKLSTALKNFIPYSGSNLSLDYAEDSNNRYLYVFEDENLQQEFGFSLELNLTSATDTNYSLELAGFLNLHAGEETEGVNTTFNASYTVNKANGLIILGFVPHIPMTEADYNALQNSPLAVMNQEEFLANETELALIILPE